MSAFVFMFVVLMSAVMLMVLPLSGFRRYCGGAEYN